MADELPTTDDDHIDAVVSSLTQIILYARKNVPPKKLAGNLRATPMPSEPITNCLYMMLRDLSAHLNVHCTRSEPSEPNVDIPIVS